MLPDWPDLKGELKKLLDEYLAAKIDELLGPLGRIPRVRLFEGSGQEVVRLSGERETTRPQEMSAKFQIRYDELPKLGLAEVLERLDSVAEEMARQIAEHIYGGISRAAEAGGTVVDAKHKPLTAETIMEGLDTLHIDFKPDGTPTTEIHIPPALGEAARKASEQLVSDKHLRQRFDELMDRKREEFRAREARRKLVG